MFRRSFAFILALLFLLPLFALADGAEWACPSCDQAGNTGNFCTNCGSPRPAESWACPACGQLGNTGNFCSNCGSPRPQDSASLTPPPVVSVNPALEQIPGETDRVKVIADRTEASSFIANKQDPARWSPLNATDGDESTCWQFSAKKGLKGKSWIQISFLSPQALDELWFKNGFWAVNDKGKDQYPINARPKAIRVEFCYSGESKFRDPLDFTLKDESRNGWQRLSLGHRESVAQLRVSVMSVYKGSAFPNDVCLSEMMAVLAAPASSAMPAQAAKAATVYESRPDVTGCNLLDKIATRSGPGTRYTGSGTFFPDTWQQETVLVRKKKYVNGVWWVQVDFRNGSKSSYRVWTGAKRVDVDLNKVKEESRICDCDIYPTTDTWFGPGGNYARSSVTINRSAVGSIFEMENGYVDVEYWYEDDGYDGSHRIWLPQSAVYNLYYGDYSGEN